MDQTNDDFDMLFQAITSYSTWIRKAAGGQSPARELRQVVQTVLFPLAAKFDGAVPDTIYAERVSAFAVEGIDAYLFPTTKIATVLWERYFLWGASTREVAEEVNYTPASVGRHVKALPRRIATQLWEKNEEIVSELAGPRPDESLDPLTSEQRQKVVLQSSFGLTEKQTLILWTFISTAHAGSYWDYRWLLGRRKIAERLFISENTLKDHITKIIKRMNAGDMNQAAQIGEALLKTHPETKDYPEIKRWREIKRWKEIIEIKRRQRKQGVT